MIFSIDRTRRDTTLFQFSAKPLRDFIDPNHVLLKIDETFDLEEFVKPLERYYCEDNGRPAIHPDVLAAEITENLQSALEQFNSIHESLGENSMTNKKAGLG